MKANIHPKYKDLTVKLVNGESFVTRSTLKAESIQLDVDTTTHPAWTGGGTFINEKAGKVAKFNDKFGALGLNKKSS